MMSPDRTKDIPLNNKAHCYQFTKFNLSINKYSFISITKHIRWAFNTHNQVAAISIYHHNIYKKKEEKNRD